MKRPATLANDNPAPAPDEGTRAQHWRQVIMGLSIKELSELTGYSVTAIRCFEANANTAGELFSEAAWQRYRMCCAGVLATRYMFTLFNWDYHVTEEGIEQCPLATLT